MQPKRAALALATLALALALAGAQAVYRWVDKNGKVHYSDQPPPEEVKNVQQKKLGGGTVEVSDMMWCPAASRSSPARECDR